jgi:PAS domain S-box-containing protein
VVFANPAMLRLVGAETAEQLIGISPVKVTRPDGHDDMLRMLSEVELSGVTSPAVEFPLMRLDGRMRHVEVVALPFVYENQKAVQVVFRDVTDQRRAEEQIRMHEQELERQVAERTERIITLERQRTETEKLVATGRMSARIAHEINNPLAGVKNSFALIKKAVPTDYKHYEFVGRIEKEIERIARIVRQMYELYRPDHQTPTHVKVADVVNDIATLLEPNARQAGVKLDLDVSRARAAVFLHEDSLRQILFNTIQNAIEASPEDAHVRVFAAIDDHNLTLAVSDQGPGIPDDVRQKIFEPFFTTKTGVSTTGGLGLGLSICKGLVDALGGKLTFDSIAGHGTTFTAVLPLNDTPKETTHA